MSKKIKNAIIVAHPDDESIFFAGLIMSRPHATWTIVCATDGNADGQGAMRMNLFRQATKMLNCKNVKTFGLPDQYDTRLDIQDLSIKIAELESFDEVFTHSSIGDYGHPHHQDVSYAVHKFYLKDSNHKTTKVWSVAYNCLSDLTVHLNPLQYQLKCKIISQIYFSETSRLIHFLPTTSTENFCEVTWAETSTLYHYLSTPPPYMDQTSSRSVDISKLEKYKWYAPYLESFRDRNQIRPF